MLFVSCVSHVFASVHCCLVVTCWERADLLILVGDVYCIFLTFLCGVLGQVWCLIVSFPDLCSLSYFALELNVVTLVRFEPATPRFKVKHSTNEPLRSNVAMQIH